jgi:hypothetical protein
MLHRLMTRLSRVSEWRDYAWEVAASSKAASTGRLPLTWPFDRDRADDLVIYWPVRYQWPPRRKWGEPIAAALSTHVRVERRELDQPYQGIVRAQARSGGRLHEVIFDTYDYPVLNSEALGTAAVYFKCQYASDGYGCDNVHPAGYIPNEPRIYQWLPALRQRRDQERFACDVFGRFGLDLATEVRTRALGLLRSTDRFAFEGGGAVQRYSRFLRDIARSRICIDLPGNGPFCFRLIDYFAVGSCVVAYPHGARLTAPLVAGDHLVYCEPDFSDLEEKCAELLAAPARVRSMCEKSREYFDRYLDRRQLGAYYVGKIIEHLR